MTTTVSPLDNHMSTMLMTGAAEEDPRIAEHQQPSRNATIISPFNIDSHKVKYGDYNQSSSPTRSVRFGGKSFSGDNLAIQKNYASPKPVIGGYDTTLLSPSTDIKSCFPQHDDGYSTDSKSNTSPSTISPLSSSLSSLSTFDGSFASHTPSGVVGTPPTGSFTSTHISSTNPVMSGNVLRSSAPKHSLIQGNGKIHVNRHAIMAAKKKDVPQEMLDSPANLEDRLRALTTIEEEEPGISHALSNDNTRTNVDTSFLLHRSRQNQNIGSVSLGPGSNVSQQSVSSSNSGCFRAVPVEIVASQFSRDHKYTADGDVQNSQPAITQSLQSPNDKNWNDYKRYFEKDCDIPLHNIDFSNMNKFIGTDVGNVPDKDINRELATGVTSSDSDSRSSTFYTQAHTDRNGTVTDRILSDQPNASIGGSRSLPVHQAPFRSHHHQTPVRYDPWHQGDNMGQHGVPAPSSDCRSHSLPRNLQTSSMLRVDDAYQHDPQQTFQKDSWNSGPPSHHQSTHLQQQQMQQYQQPQMQRPYYKDEREAQQQSRLNFDSGPTSSLKYPSLSNSFNPLPNQLLNSMPNSRNQRDSTQPFQEDVVLRRSWAASSSQLGQHVNRPHNVALGDKLNSTGTERYSLDLGNIPLLQQQIRATSEMCLQASKRHIFASSADIYKLFQGQKKAGGMTNSSSTTKNFPRTRDQSNRHSFHATPGNSWQKPQLPQPLRTTSRENNPTVSIGGNPSLLSANHPPLFHQTSPSPGPLRADHLLLPQMSWANNLPPSSSSSTSTTFPVSLSDIKHFQRQSSGYSSENELQQIEQNAKSTKNKYHEGQQQQHSSLNGIPSEQNFVPVDPSLDQDSSSSILTDNEPVYVNQPALAAFRMQQSGQKGSGSPMQGGWDQDDSLSQPPPPSPPPPPLPARPNRLMTTPKDYADAPSDPMLPRNDHVNNSRLGSSPTPPITQHQVINLHKKPVTIRSYVPNFSYSNTNNSPPGQSFDQGGNGIGGHILTLNPPDISSNQGNSPPENRNNFKNNSSTGFTKGSNSFNSQRPSSNPRVQLSPQEIAQVLEVPFATSVISDESGDRLSTLV